MASVRCSTRIMLEHLSGGVSMKRGGGKGEERKKGRRKKNGERERKKKDASPGIESRTFRVVGQSSSR